jgi:hypothetical protein
MGAGCGSAGDGLQRAPLPPPQRHDAVPHLPNPAHAVPLVSADVELLNLELYRAVAEANKEPAHRAVSHEASWGSVDSDRQLALRLQTQEVMEHSMSQEWSAASHQSSRSVLSELSSWSMTSGHGQSWDAEGYRHGEDVDDETLRRLLPPSRSMRSEAALPSHASTPSHSSVSSVSSIYPSPIPMASSPHRYPIEGMPPMGGGRGRGQVDALDRHPHMDVLQHGDGGSRSVRVWVMRHGARLDELVCIIYSYTCLCVCLCVCVCGVCVWKDKLYHARVHVFSCCCLW